MHVNSGISFILCQLTPTNSCLNNMKQTTITAISVPINLQQPIHVYKQDITIPCDFECKREQLKRSPPWDNNHIHWQTENPKTSVTRISVKERWYDTSIQDHAPERQNRSWHFFPTRRINYKGPRAETKQTSAQHQPQRTDLQPQNNNRLELSPSRGINAGRVPAEV